MKLLIFSTLLSICKAANILIVIPFTSTSHYMMLRPIGLELARVGHNVSVITAFKEKKHPINYHQIIADDKKIWQSLGNGGRPNVFQTVDFWFNTFKTEVLWKGGLFTTETALNTTEVQEFLSKDNKFDLVICELFYQEALTMLAHKYQAPLVLATTYGNSMRSNYLLRNPLQLATVYHEFGYFEKPYSFYSRLKNFIFLLYELFWFYVWYMPLQESLVTKYLKDLPSPVPNLLDIHKNVSLVLFNGHVSMDSPIAYYPNIVEIGGIHLYQDMTFKKLPRDLQEYLDEAKEGVVYMNFGSNVKSSELPAEKRDAFLKVFATLKQKVLWKWEDGNLTRKPDNVLTRPWLPQREILSHPNVRLFISHGGLIGSQEAVFRAVPVLGIPIYCDQFNNLLRAEEDGYGLLMQYKDINESNLKYKINTLLNDPAYKENAKIISNRFKDRLKNPLETAVFWIEYVIRNKGANYMKPKAIMLNWLAWSMIDVYAFVLTVTVFGFYVLKRIIFWNLTTDFSMMKKVKTN